MVPRGVSEYECERDPDQECRERREKKNAGEKRTVNRYERDRSIAPQHPQRAQCGIDIPHGGRGGGFTNLSVGIYACSAGSLRARAEGDSKDSTRSGEKHRMGISQKSDAACRAFEEGRIPDCRRR